MEKELMFTLTDVAALCNLILAIAAVMALVLNMVKKVREPDKKQDDRIRALEIWKEEMERFVDKDNHRIDKLENNLSMMMKTQFALLSHAVNGNDIEHLKKVQIEMQDYLLQQGISV